MEKKKYSELTEFEKIESNFTWLGALVGVIIVTQAFIIFLIYKFII